MDIELVKEAIDFIIGLLSLAAIVTAIIAIFYLIGA
jgi:hypothetical protein